MTFNMTKVTQHEHVTFYISLTYRHYAPRRGHEQVRAACRPRNLVTDRRIKLVISVKLPQLGDFNH